MSMPFYVAPEQVMKDRADYARKGIARGRALIAVTFDEGILIVSTGTGFLSTPMRQAEIDFFRSQIQEIHGHMRRARFTLSALRVIVNT